MNYVLNKGGDTEMKKFIVLESYCGSTEDVYTIEANDVFEAYELGEEKGHNLSSITVYDLQEARKLALKIIKEVRKNAKIKCKAKEVAGYLV